MALTPLQPTLQTSLRSESERGGRRAPDLRDHYMMRTKLGRDMNCLGVRESTSIRAVGAACCYDTIGHDTIGTDTGQ